MSLSSQPPPVAKGSGSSEGVNSLIREARELNRRFRGLETIDAKLVNADLRAASTGKGSNGENAARQNIRQILTNPNRSKFFTDAEKKAMEKVVRGSKGQKVSRWLGSFAPTGIVSGGISSAVGGSVGGVPGALTLMTIGHAARKNSERITQKHIDELIGLISGGEKVIERTRLGKAADRINLSPEKAAAATIGTTASVQ